MFLLAAGKIDWSSSGSTCGALECRCHTATGRSFWIELMVIQVVTLPTWSAAHC